VPSRGSDVLLDIIKQWIRPGTTVVSDCWKAYDCLSSEGFVHESVNHSKNFIDPQSGAHMQNTERTWREVRGGIPRFGRSEKHMAGIWPNFCLNANIQIMQTGFTLSSLRSANFIPLLPSNLSRPCVVLFGVLRIVGFGCFVIVQLLTRIYMFGVIFIFLKMCYVFSFHLLLQPWFTTGLRDIAPSNCSITATSSRGTSTVKVCYCIFFSW